MVDSHCHLDVTQAVSGLPPAEALERAGRVGVTRIVQIGCDVQGSGGPSLPPSGGRTS